MSKSESERPWAEIYEYYKGEFKKNYPVAFSVLEIGGVHPDKQSPVPNPYLDNALDDENFSNVGRHCVAVGIAAHRIAGKLLESGIIDQATHDSAISRALLHDANKCFEVFRRKAQKAGKSVDVYGVSSYDKLHEVLKSQGQGGPLLDYMASAGKETGHNSLPDFVTVDESGNPKLRADKTMEELIVHLADDMTSSPMPDEKRDTEFVTISERMELSDFEHRYPFLYTEGFGFDENGNAVRVKDSEAGQKLKCFKTYAEWQKLTARMICAFLKDKNGEKRDVDPENYIKSIINNVNI